MSATLTAARENTLGRVVHPDVMVQYGFELHLIEDPLVDRLAKGDATFGWEGDERYALYVNLRMHRWELWRLEADNVMRLSVAIPGDVTNGNDVVAWLIKWIVEHDGRRGFNPAEFVIEQSIRHQKEADAKAHEFNAEAADRLELALMHDIGATEGSGATKRLHTSASITPPSSPPKELLIP